MTTYPDFHTTHAEPPTLRLGVVLGALAAGLLLVLVALLATDTITFAGHSAGRVTEVVQSGGTTADRIAQLEAIEADQ